MIIVTTPTIPGRVILKTLGLVEGSGLASADARSELLKQAEELGASGIVGYNATAGGGNDGNTVFIQFGTAVVLKQ